MTWLLTDRGYELIGVDGSEEMLAAAMRKRTGGGHPPIFLHQSMPQLDLLRHGGCRHLLSDSLNYLTCLPMCSAPSGGCTCSRPGGLLVFDINTVAAGGAGWTGLSDETEDTYCVWRTEYHRGLCTYYMDSSTAAGTVHGSGSWRSTGSGPIPRGAHRLAEGCRFQRYPHLGRRKAAPSHGKRAADLFFLYQRVRSFS